MIRLTKQSDYGIVLVTEMAAVPDQRHNAPDLAAHTHLPLPMVSKILKILVKAGLLESTRGVKGGYRLSRSAREISVAQVIAALEGPIAITECSEETTDECDYESICRVRGNWLRINRAVREALEQISLEEMAQPWMQPLVANEQQTRGRQIPGGQIAGSGYSELVTLKFDRRD